MWILIVLFLSVLSCDQLHADSISFRKDIAPILIDNCIACHGGKKAEGNYRVDSFAKLIAPGDSESAPITARDTEHSELLRRLTSSDVGERMPLEGEPLKAEQIALFKLWIEQGATSDGTTPESSLTSIVPPPVHPAAPEVYPASLPIAALAFTPDGNQLVVGGYHELTVWDSADGRLARRIANIGQRVNALAFHQDGKTLAVGCGAPGRLGEVRMVDFESGRVKNVFGTTTDCIYDLAFSPDGKLVAVAAADSLVRVFEVDTATLQRSISSHSDWVMAVAWNSDGTKLASASRDKTAKVFDVASGDLLITYSAHNQPVKGIAFHPEGNEIYSAGGDNKLHRWKVADAAKTAEVVFGGEVTKLLRGDGFLFATSADKTVREFDAQSHAQLRTFEGHSDWVLSSAYHASTKRLATGSFDGEVRLWNAADGQALAHWKAIPGISNISEKKP